MKILISAAEASSDAHGAQLLQAIQKQVEIAFEGSLEKVEAFGIGGPKLQAAGLRTIVDARELLVMGFSEVLGRLPKIFRLLDRIANAAEKERPELAIVIDYPDFHFLLARRFKKLKIPVIYYIPPKVWVWRKSRVKILRKFFDQLLCILPYEENFYRSLNIPAKYVGNPLVDELPFHLSREEARKTLSLGKSDLVLTLMPGSRPAELKYHFKVMLESASVAAQKFRDIGLLKPHQRLKILMPLPSTTDITKISNQVDEWVSRKLTYGEYLLDIEVYQDRSAECLIASDAGIIKSGTSTLEAGLLRCPHAVIYKPSSATSWIYKHFIRYSGPVALVNLIAGGGAFSEGRRLSSERNSM